MAKLLTTIETATRLGITPQRVRMLIKIGRLPAQRIGRDWLISEKDLAEFVPRGPGRVKCLIFPEGSDADDISKIRP